MFFSRQHSVCVNYVKTSSLLWERLKEYGLISGLGHFLLVFLFEFVVGQSGLDGVLCEHLERKMNTTIKTQGRLHQHSIYDDIK